MALRVVVVGVGGAECLPGLVKFDLAEVQHYCGVKRGKRRHHHVQLRGGTASAATSSARPGGHMLRAEPPRLHPAGEPLDTPPHLPEG